MEQFSRTELIFGKNVMEKLSKSRVAIFGIGGVGGYAAEALARCGIGALDLIDNDKVSITNLNRQIYALHSTIGKFKVNVARDRIIDINPDIKLKTYNIFYSQETAQEIDFREYDYVIDAIDTVSSKILLVENANKTNTPIISSMGTGNKINPCLFEVSDIYKTSVCPLARVMRHELKKRNIKKLKVVYSKENPIKPLQNEENFLRKQPPASVSYVPSVAGLIIAGEVVLQIVNN